MGVRLKEPKVYYLSHNDTSSRSEDYADYYRYSQSTDGRLSRDELFSCISYQREGECIEYPENDGVITYFNI